MLLSMGREGGRLTHALYLVWLKLQLLRQNWFCFDFPEHIKTKQTAEIGVMSLRDKSSGNDLSGAECEEQFCNTMTFITF